MEDEINYWGRFWPSNPFICLTSSQTPGHFVPLYSNVLLRCFVVITDHSLWTHIETFHDRMLLKQFILLLKLEMKFLPSLASWSNTKLERSIQYCTISTRLGFWRTRTCNHGPHVQICSSFHWHELFFRVPLLCVPCANLWRYSQRVDSDYLLELLHLLRTNKLIGLTNCVSLWVIYYGSWLWAPSSTESCNIKRSHFTSRYPVRPDLSINPKCLSSSL